MIQEAKDSAREGMRTIRKVVETLRSDDGNIITESLDELINHFAERVNISIDKVIEDEIYELSKDHHDTLYRVVQECMTNSIRHGQATHIDINIHLKGDTIHFRVKDNGQGAEEVFEGYGLKGMKERLSHYKGHVRYKNDDGFEVKGYIEVKND
jgi:signal transduction histidine kinase